MNSNKTSYPSLQRQRPRRRSDHLSPTSPSFPRRLVERTNRYSDALSPGEATSGTDESDSPAGLTLTTSLPNYDRRALPPAPPGVKDFEIDIVRHHQRSSEDHGRARYRTSDENARPATSDATDPHLSSPYHNLRTMRQYSELPLRAKPATSNTSPDGIHDHIYERPATRHEESTLSPSFRASGFPSPGLDRPSFDESLHVKGHAGKKSRLNLLNPMSLLARRRSSQNQKLDDVNLSIKTFSVPALPDDFDPSIRGKVVHDFSAPRTRRVYSQNNVAGLESPAVRSAGPVPWNEQPSGRLSTGGTPNLNHSPMFREHFQDDRPTLRPDRTGYLHNFNASQTSHESQDPESVPAFAKRLPAAVPQTDSDFKPPPLENAGAPLPYIPPSERSPPPPTPPPKSTPSPKFEPPPATALPKHMTSTSSRFSFQMGGPGSSAQEKLLEEKHKQHEATRKHDSIVGDEDDDYANYDFDADDGLEEKIPGVNADLDEDDGFGDDALKISPLVARYDNSAPRGSMASTSPHDPPPPNKTVHTNLQRTSLQGFHFTPQSLTFSPTSTTNASQPTPVDTEGFPIGIANSRDSSLHGHPERYDKTTTDGDISVLGGLGISTAEIRGRRTSYTTRPQGQIFDDEDLYFDDGEFGNLDTDITPGEFDEEIFDDDTGRIRDIPAENARKFEAAKELDLEANAHYVASLGNDAPNAHKFETAGEVDLEAEAQSVGSFDVDPASAGDHDSQTYGPRTSLDPYQTNPNRQWQKSDASGLTEMNLAAYHDALAFAANQAAAEGKFDRKVSFGQDSDDTSDPPSQGRVVSNDSHLSYNFSSAIAADDGFPFDDDLDDDPMIAEANAEALENDDEGFYGREFGFYARSHSKGGTDLVNGGYFAERGSNGIKRSHSGKATFQEPSLTPITERSEWSTRNSVASLPMHGGWPASAQSLPSPGIAQLLELDSPSHDEDMSFSALLKLRGRTFGGSSSSVGSPAASHPLSSPLAHYSKPLLAPGDFASRMSASMNGRSPSAGIPESEEEDDGDDNENERSTLTQNTPRKKTKDDHVMTSQEEMPSSPAWLTNERRKGHHSRNSSSTDSVTYSRDPDGRWVLERRRTDEESGVESIVDREVLAGAHL
ncbi:hypothetical protein PV08_06985 [Exophiala spinifera]|uniref:AGC-kinase C-terminal domain-containing protein n=1 Tax=Exophiala spinifera TaxID=91928 RepID=A0A0D2BSH1_9EURO|nr:uncharacterized protein PV08_06985 [Exophiala spinifera]KIW14204.1 hypothetical protein PV08_06985 [Exophiala spinifera]